MTFVAIPLFRLASNRIFEIYLIIYMRVDLGFDLGSDRTGLNRVIEYPKEHVGVKLGWASTS